MGGGLVSGERTLLERIARGHPLADILDGIVRLIEAQSKGLLGSVLLLDPERKCVRLGAAPSLPEDYSRRLDGLPIGPTAGSCGAAAYLGEQVIVEDIADHPYWVDYRALALPFGLRACWSTPIFSPEREVLGTFALYYGEPRRPRQEELEWVESATHLASIALLRDRSAAERSRMEEAHRRLEAEIQQGRRLQSLGTLAAGIAHDFNNMLTAVQANAELALMDLDDRAACQRRLLAVQQASRQASELVRRMLTFSREHPPRRELLDLATTIDEALVLVRVNLPEGIDVERRFDDVPAVSADRIQIQQVVLNLVSNALHALGDKSGAVTLSLESKSFDDDASLPSPDLRQGTYVQLTVQDNGCGMSEATTKRVFDPFFTTKPPGDGTGLGLSTVHGIMKQHDGAVTLASVPDVGTTFFLYFPVPTATPEATVVAANARLRILLVDDEEAFLFLARRILQRAGHDVSIQADPVAAIETIRARPDAFDVVLTDVNMPGLSGTDLALQVRAFRPDLPIVMLTGFVRNEDRATAERIGVRHLLTKPLTLDELERTLVPLLQNLGPEKVTGRDDV